MVTLLMLGSALSVTAAPQFGRYDRNDRDRIDKNRVREIAYRNGLQMGQREGRFEAQRRLRMNHKDSDVYRNGLVGYRQMFGSERNYRNAFRDGFENGYRQAYRQFANNNNGGWNGGWNGSWNNGGVWNRNDRWDRRN